MKEKKLKLKSKQSKKDKQGYLLSSKLNENWCEMVTKWSFMERKWGQSITTSIIVFHVFRGNCNDGKRRSIRCLKFLR